MALGLHPGPCPSNSLSLPLSGCDFHPCHAGSLERKEVSQPIGSQNSPMSHMTAILNFLIIMISLSKDLPFTWQCLVCSTEHFLYDEQTNMADELKNISKFWKEKMRSLGGLWRQR